MSDKANPDIYRPMPVPESLQPYVRRVLIADTTEQVDMTVDVYATGYHYLSWIWRGRWQGQVDGKTLFDSDVHGPLSLNGQIGKAEVVARMQRDVGQIFLELSAFGHFQLFGITGAQARNRSDALHVLCPGLEPHLQRLLEAKDISVDDRMYLLADVFASLPKHSVPDALLTAVARMEAANGDVRISTIVDDLALAERKFRTDFETFIGLTPKTFCKALQLGQTLNHLLMSKGADLAGIAAQAGFSDQAHFTRAFAAFLGTAPKGFLEDVEATLARFVGQSRQ